MHLDEELEARSRANRAMSRVISILFPRSRTSFSGRRSEEEAQDLPTEVFPPGLFVVHNATGSGHHDEPAILKQHYNRYAVFSVRL